MSWNLLKRNTTAQELDQDIDERQEEENDEKLELLREEKRKIGDKITKVQDSILDLLYADDGNIYSHPFLGEVMVVDKDATRIHKSMVPVLYPYAGESLELLEGEVQRAKVRLKSRRALLRSIKKGEYDVTIMNKYGAKTQAKFNQLTRKNEEDSSSN